MAPGGLSPAPAGGAGRSARAWGAAPLAALAALGEVVLRAHAQILFSSDRVVGALLLAATLTQPRAALFGLLAVLVSQGAVRAFGFDEERAAHGAFAFNALLLGLALGSAFAASPALVFLLVVAAVALLFVQAALEGLVGQQFNLPVLSLPFTLVMLVLLAAAPVLSPLRFAAAEPVPALLDGVPGFFTLYLCALGEIFLCPTPLAGLLVLLALLRFSRIAALLSLLGFSAAALVAAQVWGGAPLLPLIAGYNGIMTALALGCIWFVPQRSALLFAAVAALATALLATALHFLLGPLHLPVLILPFNLALPLFLQAMRQRVRDRSPKSVDFAPGTPEQNLAHHRTRLARFGGGMPVRLQLPFFGRWTVTQGIDGAHTHQGIWRHALDFEVSDREGKQFAGPGTALKDYYCYRLPVFAAAAGTVVRVVDDLPDNQVGERSAQDPWGNLVLIQHAPALFSMVAHLSPGSIEVVAGQPVAAGQRLGLCGNSGRSFVPHLHFQLQSTARVGAPTRELELHDVVVDGPGGPRLSRVHVPAEGESLRNPERREEVAQLLALPIGTRYTFAVDHGSGCEVREVLVSRIDLFNNLSLESESTGQKLCFESQGRQFLVQEYRGGQESVLELLQLALPRLPFEPGAGLRWDDVVSRRHLRSRLQNFCVDLVEPFLSSDTQRLDFRSAREGSALLVLGEGRRGRGRISTRARLVPGTGLTELLLEDGRGRRGARLLEVRPAAPPPLRVTAQAAVVQAEAAV